MRLKTQTACKLTVLQIKLSTVKFRQGNFKSGYQ